MCVLMSVSLKTFIFARIDAKKSMKNVQKQTPILAKTLFLPKLLIRPCETLYMGLHLKNKTVQITTLQ